MDQSEQRSTHRPVSVDSCRDGPRLAAEAAQPLVVPTVSWTQEMSGNVVDTSIIDTLQLSWYLRAWLTGTG